MLVIAKATEGYGVNDSQYANHRAAAYKALKWFAAYHFGWFNQEPVTEARHFFLYANLRVGDGAILDAENWGVTDPNSVNYARDKAMRDATPWTQRVEFALRWLREIRRLTLVDPVLYVNWTWIKGFRTNSTLDEWAELCSYDWWLADYDSHAPGVFPTVDPKVPGGVTPKIILHQWTTNNGTFDDDALMDPNRWETLTIPPPVAYNGITAEEYQTLLDRIESLQTSIDGLPKSLVDSMDRYFRRP